MATVHRSLTVILQSHHGPWGGGQSLQCEPSSAAAPVLNAGSSAVSKHMKGLQAPALH